MEQTATVAALTLARCRERVKPNVVDANQQTQATTLSYQDRFRGVLAVQAHLPTRGGDRREDRGGHNQMTVQELLTIDPDTLAAEQLAASPLAFLAFC